MLKKASAIFLCVVGVSYSAWEICNIAISSPAKWAAFPYGYHDDFFLRWNEADCVRQGINPYDVLCDSVRHPKYYGLDKPELMTQERNEPIGVYPPWEYTLMLPLTFVPRDVAWQIYYAIMIFSFLATLYLAYRYGRELADKFEDGLLCVGFVLVFFSPIQMSFLFANYSLQCAAALLLMARALQRKHDVLAGICWSILMVKPQQGILFAIPLLLFGKYKTCIVATVICLLLSIVPVTLTNESLIGLILQAPKGSLFGFSGCAMMPKSLASWLVRSCGFDYLSLLYLAMGIGIVACIYLTRALKRETTDWLVLLVPATICSVCWTYCWTLGWVMCALVAVYLARLLIECPTVKRATVILTALFFVSQGFETVRMYLPCLLNVGTGMQLEPYVHWCSLVGFLLTAILMMRHRRKGEIEA